jgi:hypothetical protein
MSGSPNPIQGLLQEIQTLTGVAAAVAPGDANQINKVSSYVQLGTATIPIAATFLGDLFHLFGGLFHHMAAVQAPVVQPPPTQTGQSQVVKQ